MKNANVTSIENFNAARNMTVPLKELTLIWQGEPESSSVCPDFFVFPKHLSEKIESFDQVVSITAFASFPMLSVQLKAADEAKFSSEVMQLDGGSIAVRNNFDVCFSEKSSPILL